MQCTLFNFFTITYKEERVMKFLQNKSKNFRLGVIVICFCLLLCSVLCAYFVWKNSKNIPIQQIPDTSASPIYYGHKVSIADNSDWEFPHAGISVTAKLAEALPDTYTFYDDWQQTEFRILKMKTVSLLNGQEITDEFYYTVPVDFMTDFSFFDKFVILDMVQIGYEYHIMYNKTQDSAERLDLVLFGYSSYGYPYMGENMMAFDSNDIFDPRLWNANDNWIDQIRENEISTDDIHTLKDAEEKARRNSLYYVHSLKDVSGEAAEVLASVTSFENGLYVPQMTGDKLLESPDIQFRAIRYLNGFATNESVSIFDKDWTTDSKTETFSFSKARFTQDDVAKLPNLASAITSIANAYNEGKITPPHMRNYKKAKLSYYGIFGWYAKTDDGVIGIVRVTWNYVQGADDSYYIVEYGSDVCKAINRDDLLERIGEYETTYIYQGEYDKSGKDLKGSVAV